MNTYVKPPCVPEANDFLKVMGECPPGLPFGLPTLMYPSLVVLYPPKTISWLQLWFQIAASPSWGVDPEAALPLAVPFPSPLQKLMTTCQHTFLLQHQPRLGEPWQKEAGGGVSWVLPKAASLMLRQDFSLSQLVGRARQRELLPEDSLFQTQEGS